MKSKKEKIINIILISAIIIVIVLSILVILYYKKENTKIEDKHVTTNFTYELIKQAYTDNKNMLISPLSIEYALSILKDGSDGNTYSQINNSLGDVEIKNTNIKDRISIANALFIKNDYKNNISNLFVNNISSKYSADIIYDDFTTPDTINNWVKEKTFNMIPQLLNEAPKDIVLGIANALAIDVEWKYPFECNNTNEEEFNNKGQIINVAMMHEESKNGELLYLKNNKVTGVSKKYKTYSNEEESKTLEYIALMTDNIKDYVESFSKQELDSLLTNSTPSTYKKRISLSLPKYTYDYTIDDMKPLLSSLGMKDMFDPNLADFSKMTSDSSKSLYVEDSIHKTKIELNENGTKASAATFLGMKETSILEDEYEKINIEFNKPFIYIIKENDNILFFGVVTEPNKYEELDNNCK